MTISKSTILVSIMTSFFLLLGACGSDDSGTTDAPATSAVSEPTPAAASGGEALSMDSIEKAEGVVYQDEIYANWPYNEE
jgi:hypothetical protein